MMKLYAFLIPIRDSDSESLLTWVIVDHFDSVYPAKSFAGTRVQIASPMGMQGRRGNAFELRTPTLKFWVCLR
jgi:hypothetical protein